MSSHEHIKALVLKACRLYAGKMCDVCRGEERSPIDSDEQFKAIVDKLQLKGGAGCANTS